MNDNIELNKLTDNELMRRVIKNDQWAMHELYRRHYRFVLGVLKIHLTEFSELDRCYNKIMLCVWTNAEKFNPNRNFRAWMYKFCCKEARRAMAQERIKRQRKAAQQSTEESKADTVESEQLSFWREINAAIRSLPRKPRKFMELYIAAGSIDEAAKVMAIQTDQARALYQFARPRLPDIEYKHLEKASH